MTYGAFTIIPVNDQPDPRVPTEVREAFARAPKRSYQAAVNGDLMFVTESVYERLRKIPGRDRR